MWQNRTMWLTMSACFSKLFSMINNLQEQVKNLTGEKTKWTPKKYDNSPEKRKKFANIATDATEDLVSAEESSADDTECNLITPSSYLATCSTASTPTVVTKSNSNLPLDILDSGANSSHVNDRSRFHDLQKSEQFVIQTADGGLAESSGEKGHIGSIPGVNYTPQFKHNLVSVSKLTKMGYKVGFDAFGALVTDAKTNRICGTGRISNGLYFINLHKIEPSSLLIEKKRSQTEKYDEIALIANNICHDSWSRWHFRLHLPKRTVNQIMEAGAVDGLDICIRDLKKQHLNCLSCAECQTDKQSKELGYPFGKPIAEVGGQLVTYIWQMALVG